MSPKGERRRSESIIERMMIDKNEAQGRTVEQVREVLAGTQQLQLQPTQDDAERYGWIDAVLRRLAYRQLRSWRSRRAARLLAAFQRLQLCIGHEVDCALAGGRDACGAQQRPGARLHAPLYSRRRGAPGRGGSRHGHALGAGHSPRAAPRARRLRRYALRPPG